MGTTTYDHAAYGRTSTGRAQGGHSLAGIGEAFLNWLGRVGERSAAGRAAANFQQLNALSDEQLAELGLTRAELATRCFGWRIYS